MIWLSKFDGTHVLVNPDHIVLVEVAHDSIVALAGGERLRVQESPREITRRIAEWRRRISVAEALFPDDDGDEQDGS